MKKVLISLVVMLLFACGNKQAAQQDSVTGIWKPYTLNLGEMNEDEKKELIERATIEFTADGKYISLFKGEPENGTYTYNEKDLQLVTVPADGKEEKFKVEWKEGRLGLSNTEGSLVLERVKK